MKNKLNSTFYIISFGQVFSLIGSSVAQFSIIWWLTIETNSPVVLSFAAISGLLPQAVLGPFIGAFVDNHNRKVIMIVSDIVIASATLVLIVFFVISSPPIWVVYLILIIRSIGNGFHMPSMQSSIPMIVAKEKLTSAASVTQSVESISYILGPALGAFMFSIMKVEFVLLIDIVGAIIASITLLLVKIPNPVGIREKNGVLKDISKGLKELVKHKGVLNLAILLSINSLVYIPATSLYPLMVTGTFKGGAFHISTVEIVFAVGALIGSITLGIIGNKYKKSSVITIALLTTGLVMIVIGFLNESGFLWFVLLIAIMGLAWPLYYGAFMVIVQRKVNPSLLGRVISVINSMKLLIAPIGLLVAGPVGEKVGVEILFIFSGILIVVSGIICICICSNDIKAME